MKLPKKNNATNIFIHSKCASSLLSDFVEFKRGKSKRVGFLFGFLQWKGKDSPDFQLKRFNNATWIIDGVLINLD